MQFPVFPQVTKSDFISWNENMFKKYFNERVYNHSNPFIRFVESQRVKVIISCLQPITSSDNILAAGCGEGYLEKQIPTKHLTLVDISPSAIKLARQNLPHLPPNRFLLANLEKLPLKNQLFSKIICSEVIEHVYSPNNLISELARVALPHAKLVMSFPNEPLINYLKKVFIKLGIFHLVFPNVPKDMTTEWHLRSMHLSLFRNLMRAHWRIQSVYPIPWSFLPIRYVVTCSKINASSTL
jgi:2-polyprenyl-3-methyl-5-hydroxy-6-metoxy-1,4-benzoquinol methylase